MPIKNFDEVYEESLSKLPKAPCSIGQKEIDLMTNLAAELIEKLYVSLPFTLDDEHQTIKGLFNTIVKVELLAAITLDVKITSDPERECASFPQLAMPVQSCLAVR